jgi:hypothetical protein
MSIPLIVTLVLAPCLGIAVLLLVRRITSPASISECDSEWLSNFSISAYRPMLRLLSESDYTFLATQPGITKETIRQLRRDRRRIFRAYLRNLVRDFHRLHLAARMTLIYSSQDRPDLAKALMLQRVRFAGAVLQVEYRLCLHTFGLGHVDVTDLLGALEGMRMNVSSLGVAAQPAGI